MFLINEIGSPQSGSALHRVIESRAKLSGQPADEPQETATPIQPVKNLGGPRDIAALAASDAAKDET